MKENFKIALSAVFIASAILFMVTTPSLTSAQTQAAATYPPPAETVESFCLKNPTSTNELCAAWKNSKLIDFRKQSEDKCDEAYKEFKDNFKFDSEFSKSCKANNSAADYTCLFAAEKCKNCTGEIVDSGNWKKYGCEDIADEDAEEEDFDGYGNALLKQAEEISRGKKPKYDEDDVTNTRNLLNNCPIEPAGELADVKETYKEERERQKDLKKEEKELREDFENNKIEFAEVSAELYGDQECIKKGMGPGHPDYNEQCAGIDEKLNLEISNLTKEYSEQAAKQFQQINDQIRDLAIAMQTSKNKLFDEETKLMNFCHQRGLEAVKAEKDRREARLKTSSLSVNGFSSVSDLKSLQARYTQIGLDAYNSCLKKDEQVKRQLASLREYGRLEQERLQAQMDKMLRLQTETINKMTDSKKNPELGKAIAEARKTSAARKKELQKRYAQLEAKLKAQYSELQILDDELLAVSFAAETAKLKRDAAKAKKISSGKDSDRRAKKDIITAANNFANQAEYTYSLCCPISAENPATPQVSKSGDTNLKQTNLDSSKCAYIATALGQTASSTGYFNVKEAIEKARTNK